MNIYIYIYIYIYIGNIFISSNSLTYSVIEFMHLAMYATRIIDKLLVRCIHLILEILSRSHALGVILFDVNMQSHSRVSLVKVLLLSHCFSLALTCLHW